MTTTTTPKDTLAELDAMLSQSPPDPQPAAVPNWRADTEFLAVENRRASIEKELNDLSAELSDLTGDDETPGTLPVRFARMSAEQARQELEAVALAGGAEAAKHLAAVERLAQLKARRPILERAKEIATKAAHEEADKARRRAFPKAEAMFKPVARRAALAWLRILPEFADVFELYSRLRMAGVEDTTANPFAAGELPADASRPRDSRNPSGGVAGQLDKLLAAGLLSRSEIESVLPGYLDLAG